MIRILVRPLLLKAALAAMSIALITLVWLQFRWSEELGRAYEERLGNGLSEAAAGFRTTFQQDLNSLCRSIQVLSPNEIRSLPPANIPYQLYWIDATFERITRFDRLTRRFEPVVWPANRYFLREELSVSAEDLSTATARRWFNRPWLASSALPALFRAVATDWDWESEERIRRIDGFFVVLLEADALSRDYFPAAQRRSFSASLADSRAVILFQDATVFDSHPGFPSAPRHSIRLDLLAPNSGRSASAPIHIRPATDTGGWSLRAELHPGTLDATVSSLRMRTLATGLGVALVLVAGIVVLMLANRRAESLARQQADFVAGFSHELRTPVAAVCALAGNLRDGLTTDPVQVRRYGQLILEQGNRLRARMEDILSFAAGRNPPVQMQPVALITVIEAVLAEEAALLQGFEIESASAAGLPMVQADPVLLKSCLANLVLNSAKYAREAAWLGIQATADGQGWLRLQILDRGPGIPARELKRIFEPFYRGEQARASTIPGSGLGLHLVQTRIEAMGGQVNIESTPGRGTCITLLLRTTSE